MTLPAAGEVVVRVLALDLDAEPDLDALSPAERTRAAGFVRAADRYRYVAARAALRTVLGVAVGVAPAALRIGQTPRGRPFLADPPAPWLDFNVSHSGARALIALASGRRVGVDLEALDAPGLDVDVVARSLAASERDALARLPPSQRRAAFFAVWVRKEAYVKARGAGLGMPLDGFDVAVGPHLRGRQRVADGWWIADLHVGEGFAAAVAVSGSPSWRLRLRRVEAPL